MTASRTLDYDRLVTSIYDTVDHPDGLTAALGEVAAFVGGVHGQSMVFAPSGELTDHRHVGLDTDTFDAYLPWRDQDPRMLAAIAKPGVVHSDMTFMDRAAFERTAIYNEFLSRQGGHYTLFGNFSVEDGFVLAQAFMRTSQAGPFDEQGIGRMTALMPHMQRATRLRQLMHTLERDLADLRRALDWLPMPLAILDASAKVTCANSAAEQLLRSSIGLRTKDGELTSAEPSEARDLSAAIARALLLADTSSERVARGATTPTTVVTIERGLEGPLQIVFFAIRPLSAIRGRAAPRARVVAMIHDPHRRLLLDPALLAKLYGFTAVEAQLASALVDECTVTEFAEARGCSVLTVRTHLKRILEKTNTRRQADLVRTLLVGATLHTVR